MGTELSHRAPQLTLSDALIEGVLTTADQVAAGKPGELRSASLEAKSLKVTIPDDVAAIGSEVTNIRRYAVTPAGGTKSAFANAGKPSTQATAVDILSKRRIESP
jgi:hypothetical protein